MTTTHRIIPCTLHDAYEEAMRWLAMTLRPDLYSHNRLLEMLADEATVDIMRSKRRRCCFREVHEQGRIAPNGRLQVLFVRPYVSLSLAAAVYACASRQGDIAARIVERQPLTDDLWIGIMDSSRQRVSHNIPRVSRDGVALHETCDMIYHGGVCFVQLIHRENLPAPK